MPRVPTYDQGQAVMPSAPGAQTISTPDVSSGARAVAGGVDKIGAALDAAAERDAEAQANAADARVTASWLEWDANARKQYQGQNVAEYQAEATKWWDKAREDTVANTSAGARERIGVTLGRKRNQAMASVLGYVNAETERFADTQAESAAQTSIEFGVDTGDTAGAATRVRQIVAEKGARKGWTTEMVQADEQRLLGTLHLSYISQLAQQDPAKAQAYYTANKGEIPATAQPRVEQVLKNEADNHFAIQFADERAGKPLAEQLQDASGIPDPERKKKALQEIHNNAALVKAAQQEREAAAADSAWQLVGQGKRVPETVLMQMDGRSRVQLQDYLRERAKQAAAGETHVKTDWPLYLETREKLAAGENVDLRPLATKIAGAQLEQLIDIKTKSSAPGKTPEVATSEQQISTYVNRLQLKDEEKGQLLSQAYGEFNAVLKRTGKEPSFDERQQILDRLTMDVITDKGVLWDSKEKGYKLTEEQRKATGFSAQPDKFTAGKVYKDKAGNRAKYLGGGKWENVQ